jgi:hypothetical protein
MDNNQPIGAPVAENKIPPSYHRKVIIIILILAGLFVIFRVLKVPQRISSNYLENDSPYLETCIQSNNFVQDSATGNSLGYIECLKGYSRITNGFSGGETIVSQITSGYIISNNNGKTISIIQAYQHSNGGLRSGISPDVHFPDSNFFINATGDLPLKDTKLAYFDGTTVKETGSLPFDARGDFILYKNNQVYYHDYVGNIISRYDLTTGQSDKIADLSSIPRDSFYNHVYNIKAIETGNTLTMGFGIITSYDPTTSDQQWTYYTMNLLNGEVQKDPRKLLHTT